MKIYSTYIPKMKSFVEFKIGMNAEENFKIIDESSPNDIWFHINNRPSEHVVARIPENITKKGLSSIIKQGCNICKHHSKYSSEKNVEVIYTKIENITKTIIIGTVEVKNEKLSIC
jgi:predicted ribosome quality control (RQC) complex YloA/Tae2 family protein